MVLPALPVRDIDPEIVLYADGGTLGGSPGSRGIYWSVDGPLPSPIRRTDTSGRMRRSDEAEFMALRTALEVLTESARPGSVARVVTDCSAVAKYLGHTPACKRLQRIHAECRQLLAELRFRGVRVVIRQEPRSVLVEALGH